MLVPLQREEDRETNRLRPAEPQWESVTLAPTAG
jgi:hypothetical protein